MAQVTISNGASLSDAIDIHGFTLFKIEIPSAWTTANLTFQALSQDGTTWKNVYDDEGNEVSITVGAANTIIVVDMAALKIAPLGKIRLRSGTAAAAVAQGAERTLYVDGKRD